MAWVLDAEMHSGSIRPVGLFGGRAVWGRPETPFGADIDHIAILLAGSIAQRRFDPFCEDGGYFDEEAIRRQLAALCRSDSAARALRESCKVRATKIVDENQDAIETIALALIEHETLTGDELNDLLAGVLIDRANVREPARRAAWREATHRAAEFQAEVLPIRGGATS